MGTLRRATVEDAAELMRLRGLMHEAMGTGAQDPAWRARCTEAFSRRLATEEFVAFVVPGDGRLVSCGCGWLEEHLPAPNQFDGRRGHIASMSTEPAHQRKGHARAVFAALMGWFAERDIPRVDLRATDDGRPLYESFGFQVLGGATMAWLAPGNRPGMPAR
ncbi:MAG: GNAT family N-acetyltransferase [Actinomycetota bacterium]|nr:GNAT family N-acetyltransferase [Actinomycetota bacterium]